MISMSRIENLWDFEYPTERSQWSNRHSNKPIARDIQTPLQVMRYSGLPSHQRKHSEIAMRKQLELSLFCLSRSEKLKIANWLDLICPQRIVLELETQRSFFSCSVVPILCCADGWCVAIDVIWWVDEPHQQEHCQATEKRNPRVLASYALANSKNESERKIGTHKERELMRRASENFWDEIKKGNVLEGKKKLQHEHQ